VLMSGAYIFAAYVCALERLESDESEFRGDAEKSSDWFWTHQDQTHQSPHIQITPSVWILKLNTNFLNFHTNFLILHKRI